VERAEGGHRWAAALHDVRRRRAAEDLTVIIEAQGLVKKYLLGGTTVRALDGVDLEVPEGDMLAVTGPSGSGKSTLMHILGCLDRPDAGRYVLAGEDISRVSRNRLAEIRNRRIGFVFQTFNLLPRMNALENVELPLLYAGLRHAKDRAAAALKTVGLDDRMHHKPTQLSGGQRQRVAVARALITDPAILLADEPTGNLDSKTGEEIMALFDALSAAGRTILIVTHEPDIARRCRRQIHMRDGRIVDGQDKG
jgi:putative ABC transport system ATP-binding protein